MNLQKTIDLLEDLKSGKLPHPFVVEEHVDGLKEALKVFDTILNELDKEDNLRLKESLDKNMRNRFGELNVVESEWYLLDKEGNVEKMDENGEFIPYKPKDNERLK